MKNNFMPEINPDIKFDYSVTRSLVPENSAMNLEGLRASERINEILMMCDRERPVYEQISSFSIALYALGFFDCRDLMAVADVDVHQAADVLREHFTEIRQQALPSRYLITESRERFLLLVGDPLFPAHFSALVNMQSPKPFFSKLPFFGSGFDSLEELVEEFSGRDGITPRDFHFFKKTWYGTIPPESVGRIYIVRE